MDYQKEHNGRQTFHEHWAIPLMMLAIVLLALFLLPIISHRDRTAKIIESDDASGVMSSDSGSVYWNVLSEPTTNRIQFVLLLPVTTTIGSGSTNQPSEAHDFCNLQIKSNGHQWKIENVLDWKTGVQTVQLRDQMANTTSTLNLNDGRFWQLDEEGHATTIEKIDSAIIAKIFSQVRADGTNLAAAN
jgi:hypothetical protein